MVLEVGTAFGIGIKRLRYELRLDVRCKQGGPEPINELRYRLFRCLEMLENGTHATIAQIAAAEKINESYVGRVLRLTLLASDIVEAIVGGRQPTEMTLAVLMRPITVVWTEQRKTNFCWKNAPSGSG